MNILLEDKRNINSRRPLWGKTLGVDGCRGGWLAAWLGVDGPGICLYENIRACWTDHAHSPLILIDIPIGLSDSGARTCDRLARRLLGRGRSASVFAPPCRAALAAADYRDALARNRAVTERGISIQVWNISPKIREVDEFLAAMPGAAGIMRESHPELCFQALAGGHAMRFSKKTVAGQRERRAVLARLIPGLHDDWSRLRAALPAGRAAADDLLDALVLAVSAARGVDVLKRLPASPQYDIRGRCMEIVYPAWSGEECQA
ncbi:MAG: DUF429 domain-containing protein [Acidobacteria bacterium]|nr:DUF429 domain-containing protein [Acidobacteriota bacterium]